MIAQVECGAGKGRTGAHKRARGLPDAHLDGL